METCQGCDCLPPQKPVPSNNNIRKKHDLVYDKKISIEIINFLCPNKNCDYARMQVHPFTRLYNEVTQCFEASIKKTGNCTDLIEGPLHSNGKRFPDKDDRRRRFKKIPDITTRNALLQTITSTIEVGDSFEGGSLQKASVSDFSLGSALSISVVMQNYYRAKHFQQKIYKPMEDYSDFLFFGKSYFGIGAAHATLILDKKTGEYTAKFPDSYFKTKRDGKIVDGSFYNNYKTKMAYFCPKVKAETTIVKTNILSTLLSPLAFQLLNTSPPDILNKTITFRSDQEYLGYVKRDEKTNAPLKDSNGNYIRNPGYKDNPDYIFAKKFNITMGKRNTNLLDYPPSYRKKYPKRDSILDMFHYPGTNSDPKTLKID